MKKVLYYVRNVSLFIVTVLFIVSFSNMLNANLNNTIPPNMISMYFYFMLNLFFVGYICIEYVLQLKTKEDNYFQCLFIFVNLLIILIYGRTYFDNNIVSVYLNKLGSLQYEGLNTLFLLDNMIYFDIAYVFLLIYALVGQKKNEKNV